ELDSTLAQADSLDRSRLSEADDVTLGCLREYLAQEVRGLDARLIDHTVTPMPFSGPAVLFSIAARTLLVDERAATDYVERLRAGGTWIDQQAERLRIGAGKGRLPVAPLVQEAIEWGEHVLEADVPGALAAPRPPEGWDGEPAWREKRDAVARDVVKPALARWLELLRELLPSSRLAEEPGLVNIPGGEADYALCVRSPTTLPLTPEEIHRIGLGELERMEERALELGAELGLRSLPEIHQALRASSGSRRPDDAMAAAVAAIRRAEAHAPEFFSPPL